MRTWQGMALAAVLVAAVIVALVAPAITRGPTFHLYADRRTWLGIPNAGDVLSNLPFVVVGLVGLLRTRRRGCPCSGPAPRHLIPCVPRFADPPPLADASSVGLRSVRTGALFLSILAVGIGSGAYHVAPSDLALVFDWAPIVLTLAFLAALVVGDRIDPRAGRIACFAFPALALASVAAWYVGGGTGTTAAGDMRWYVLTQATLVVVVALTALAPPTRAAPASLDRRWILLGVAGFLAARGLAAADRALLDAVGISGHSGKHLLLGLAAACLIPSAHVQRGKGVGESSRRVR